MTDRDTGNPATEDSEPGCVGKLLLIPFCIVVTLLSIKFGDTVFMRVFYGTGDKALHLVNSKHGTLSDGSPIPPLLNALRLTIDVLPAFALIPAFYVTAVRLKRRKSPQAPTSVPGEDRENG